MTASGRWQAAQAAAPGPAGTLSAAATQAAGHRGISVRVFPAGSLSGTVVTTYCQWHSTHSPGWHRCGRARAGPPRPGHGAWFGRRSRAQAASESAGAGRAGPGHGPRRGGCRAIVTVTGIRVRVVTHPGRVAPRLSGRSAGGLSLPVRVTASLATVTRTGGPLGRGRVLGPGTSRGSRLWKTILIYTENECCVQVSYIHGHRTLRTS